MNENTSATAEEPTHVVAIDGPAAAGKSTAAKRAAARLHFAFLDTGAMYRAATWWCLHSGVNLDDEDAVARTVEAIPLRMEETPSGMRVVVDGRDITREIRTPEITRVIYKVDKNPRVRKHLVTLQRAFAQKQPTVAEGRDMGTVVFPKARCKIFLDATLEERTRRRAQQLREQGIAVDLDQLRREIEERDEHTRTRATAPLRPADDAVLLDTTNLTLDEVVDRIVALARERICV